MVLLHWLHGLGYRKLVVCHLNHQLRGRASAADARLVERTAGQVGFACVIESAPVAGTTGKHSLETAGRHARHVFFARCAQAHRCDRVFLAHHADDQAETVLMNVLRGSSLRGLGGMRSLTEMQVDNKKRLLLLRPLLAFSREELRDYAAEHAVKYREDASNQSADFLRNRIRHELLPLASRVMQRDVRPALLRIAAMAREDDACLQSQVDAISVGEFLDTKMLLATPVALQRRVLHAWMQQHGVPLISFELIESIRALQPPQSPVAKANLPGGRWVRRRAGRLFIEP